MKTARKTTKVNITKKPSSEQNKDYISKSVAELIPLYSESGTDRPDSVVGSYPNSLNVVQALKGFIDVMIPGRMTSGRLECFNLPQFLHHRLIEGRSKLQPEVERAIPFRWIGEASREEGVYQTVDACEESDRIIKAFFGRLAFLRNQMVTDIEAAYTGDPAALTYAEVKLAYPGLLAIISHRLAHELYKLDVPIVPRIMSEWTHAETGVDIHPSARIGHGCFIDHGTGVVIGETSVIGNNVKIYQGVTLGAKSFPLDNKGRPIKRIKRHPTIKDNVIIYANATILGGDTVIGSNSIIGGNVFLMESIPADSMVVNKNNIVDIKESNKNKAQSRFSSITKTSGKS